MKDVMNFTYDPEQNSELFTLTCTSIGGPATSVVWTRNSEVVPGGMTVLEDPVVAKYIHNTTITGRYGGEYRCTVSNSKPSQDSTTLNVKGTI